MTPLKVKGTAHNITDTIVGKIVSNESGIYIAGDINSLDNVAISSAEVILTKSDISNNSVLTGLRVISNLPFLNHLTDGDIVAINSDGIISTLFRSNSIHNSLFITDRCNSNCLMCSQPPKNKDDLNYFYDINSQLIKLIPKSTQELGITGGEPTLLGKRFISLLEMITEELPETDIHVLTNGRSFAWKDLPAAISKVKNPRMMFGIPLYSDYYLHHDYIVQAKDAFSQTMLGFHNMARYGLRLELRIVLHKQSIKRLPQLAQFIYKNLPFVEHIAFMGLEYTGYTPHNDDLLWMEPSEYSNQLEEAVLYLSDAGMNVSIYNLQRCVLKPALWKFSRNSISDWKRDYIDECKKCSQLDECGGVFATSKKHSREIMAIMA